MQPSDSFSPTNLELALSSRVLEGALRDLCMQAGLSLAKPDDSQAAPHLRVTEQSGGLQVALVLGDGMVSDHLHVALPARLDGVWQAIEQLLRQLQQKDYLLLSGMVMQPARRCCVVEGQAGRQDVPLTEREWQVMESLARQPGGVLVDDVLAEILELNLTLKDTGRVTSMLYRLRQKLRQAGAPHLPVMTDGRLMMRPAGMVTA